MNYTEAKLQENYTTFIEFLKKVFTGERLEKLLHMYSQDELGVNVLISPASSFKHFHNAYDGGYLDHIMGVAKNSIRIMNLYKEAGGIIDFTQEELLFAAIHHDLGKLGEPGKIHYLPNESEWHIKNQGRIYVSNPDLPYMAIADRTFWLLSHYGITHTHNEWFGISLADGMYDDDNAKYLKTFSQEKQLRSNLGHLLHWADVLTTNVERDAVIK